MKSLEKQNRCQQEFLKKREHEISGLSGENERLRKINLGLVSSLGNIKNLIKISEEGKERQKRLFSRIFENISEQLTTWKAKCANLRSERCEKGAPGSNRISDQAQMLAEIEKLMGYNEE